MRHRAEARSTTSRWTAFANRGMGFKYRIFLSSLVAFAQRVWLSVQPKPGTIPDVFFAPVQEKLEPYKV
eukprot:1388988-Rhodomonas_salina.1